jgi:pimeloyl-ACP methyl ester carboxylesterase
MNYYQYIARTLLAVAFISMTTGAQAVEPELASIWYKAGSLVSEDFMIASDTAGIELYIRNKRFADHQASSNKTVLFVHGATYPSETAFDLKLDGLSWMDYIAAHGWNVYLVDLRGYGRSTRPPEMSEPAEDNEPIVATDVAIRDVDSAVDFILERDNISKVNLIGWSWGTTIMGGYTAQTNYCTTLDHRKSANIQRRRETGGLSTSEQGSRAQTLAARRARGQSQHADSRWLVRCVGGRNLGKRSSFGRNRLVARTERGYSGCPGVLDEGQVNLLSDRHSRTYSGHRR